MINKMLAGSSRMGSAILSPMLAPTYGTIIVLWASVMCLLPIGTRITVLAVIIGITCVLPMMCIGVLHHYGFVSSKTLDKPRERRIPYAFATLCYLGAAFYLDHIHAPMWFTMFMAGSLAALLIVTLVNMWWKISAHLTGMGGIVALIYQIHVQGLSAFELFWVLCIAILFAGMLGTARLILKCHTLPQVLAGFAVGYTCVTLAMKLFG
ncbi:MAG: hypothetical protein KBT10_03535 [Bacteroidales bacterium]|nr:hypothetical protein [Candidatus Sodaliphilus aphodohippi]